MNNKKILLGTILLTGLLLSGVVLAAPKPVSSYDDPKGKVNGPAGKSHVSHLYLVEKDYTDAAWPIIADGAWGKMKYTSESFVFNGHGLEPETGYTLIYYGNTDNNDVWPYATCLASGMSTAGGNVNLKGLMEEVPIGEEAKIWLVLSSDVDCGAGEMTAWTPAEYLFEYATI